MSCLLIDLVEFKDSISLIVSLGEGSRFFSGDLLLDVFWLSCNVEVLEVLEMQVPDGVVVDPLAHGVSALCRILWNVDDLASWNHFAKLAEG